MTRAWNSPPEKAHCATCAIGKASAHGAGGLCPLIDRPIAAGDTIFSQGDPAKILFFVKEGAVSLTRDRSGGKSARVCAIRFPGSLFGTESVIGGAYAFTATAASDSVVCTVAGEGIDQWLGPKDTPARTALELTLRAHQGDVVHSAATGTAEQRVASWLCEEGPRGVTLALPRKVVADLLDMRAETLSRALAALSEQGALEVSRTTLRIADPRRLGEIAGVNQPPTSD